MQSSSRSDIDAFIVMDIVEAARKAEATGRDIIHMEIGQPSTPAPKGAMRHLAQTLERDAMGYTVSLGLPELRAKIAELYGQWYDIDLDANRVIVTAGASGAFILAFTALFDSDARVGVGEPGYPSYRQILRALGMTPVGIQTSAENRYQPVPSQIPDDLAGMILASPGNPAGTTLTTDGLRALATRCHETGTSLICDEIYHGLHYDRAAPSMLGVTDDAYIINSFSKYFSMTGWRLGWMVVPQDHVRIVERIAQNMFICAPHAAQVAGLAAMDCHDELQENIAVYARNRQIMIEGLRAVGLSNFAEPDGAFYVYVDASHITNDAVGLCKEMLERADIAVTPGVDFDPVRGHQTLRFSYAQNTDAIIEGMRRLAIFMAARTAS